VIRRANKHKRGIVRILLSGLPGIDETNNQQLGTKIGHCLTSGRLCDFRVIFGKVERAWFLSERERSSDDFYHIAGLHFYF
jgi:hypothetical protein